MMRGLTSPLWPIRYKPLPDELLSCWIVRLAHGHGLKVQTFCNQIFGSRRQVWNRDIDRLAPAWLIDELCYRTGTSPAAAWEATLRAYEGRLYRKFRSTGTLQWILSLKMYHRKRQGFGLQFCPMCLAADSTPYFRKCWRVALMTTCPKHGIQLLDRCPKCGVAVALHRIDMVKSDEIENVPLSYCHACGFDLRECSAAAANVYDEETFAFLNGIDEVLMKEGTANARWDIAHLEVLRHLCGMMTSRYKHVHLREFVVDQLAIEDFPVANGRFPFETRSVAERHHLIQLAAWLLVDVRSRLEVAWRSGAIRYSSLLKDFEEPPNWYVALTQEFSNWREKDDWQ